MNLHENDIFDLSKNKNRNRWTRTAFLAVPVEKRYLRYPIKYDTPDDYEFLRNSCEIDFEYSWCRKPILSNIPEFTDELLECKEVVDVFREDGKVAEGVCSAEIYHLNPDTGARINDKIVVRNNIVKSTSAWDFTGSDCC